MHRYFFTTKDTFISSGSNELTGEDFKDKKDIEGFPFKKYKQSSDISKYVKNVVKREKREK